MDVNRGVLPDPVLGPAESPNLEAIPLHLISRPVHFEVLLWECGGLRWACSRVPAGALPLTESLA